MSKIQQLSYRTQIFIASLSLVIFPAVLLGLFAVNDSTSKLMHEYNTSLSTITSQINLTLDTLLQDAFKVADMPILSEDVRAAMVTDYQDDYLSYAKTSTLFRDLFNQTNRLNTDLEACIFTNRYGFTFEHGIVSALRRREINQNMEHWIACAQNSVNHTYITPLQVNNQPDVNKKTLSIIKILFDKYDYKEIGVCYCEINFKPIENIMLSAQNTANTLLIYDAGDQLIFSSNPDYMQETEKYEALLSALSDFNRSLTSDSSITEEDITIGHNRYRANGCVNKTTNWHLIQFVDNQVISQIYRDNIFSYVRILILCLILGMLLAVLLSATLTRSILKLCRQIDTLNVQNEEQIDEKACGSNQELRKLVASFNHLNQRLSTSLQQNYQIQLAEQKMRIQMLQFQINHHFLYNTLNVIRSLANIHNVPQIETISLCMSDLLRYNLENFPVALLEEELAQIRRYMTIQDIRFPGKFSFDINISPDYLKMQVPAFLLQPLVENSVEHGFGSREADCYISISSQTREDGLHIFVADNGNGICPAMLEHLNGECLQEVPGKTQEGSHHSIGLQNVRQRIRSHFGVPYGLTIESREGEGTIVDLLLPAGSAIVPS